MAGRAQRSGQRASRDGDSGTSYVLADDGSYSHSASSDCADTSSDGGCDSGGGDVAVAATEPDRGDAMTSLPHAGGCHCGALRWTLGSRHPLRRSSRRAPAIVISAPAIARHGYPMRRARCESRRRRRTCGATAKDRSRRNSCSAATAACWLPSSPLRPMAQLRGAVNRNAFDRREEFPASVVVLAAATGTGREAGALVAAVDADRIRVATELFTTAVGKRLGQAVDKLLRARQDKGVKRIG